MVIVETTSVFNKNNTPYQTFVLNKQRIDLCQGCADIVMRDIENTKLSVVELLFKKK